MRRSFATLLVLTVGCAPDYAIKQPTEPLYPAISVDPTSIDFGTLLIGETLERPFSITSIGDAPLQLGALEIDPGFELTVDPSALELLPGESTEGMVSYSAELGPVIYGRIQIPNSDPALPIATIDLRGVPGIPEMEITPNPVDFGDVEVGSDKEMEVTFTNVGRDPLDVIEAYVGEPFWFGALEPITIPPGQSRSLIVHFTPPDPQPYSDLLVFTVAGLGEAPVEVKGNGTSTPTAVCSGVPASPIIPYEDVTWTGSASSDPTGRPLSYQWTLTSQPAGSTATLPFDRRADVAHFVPDELGIYTAELVVTNDLGLSDSCEAQIEAVGDKPVAMCSASPNPAEALRDPVTWSGAGSYDPGGTSITYAWSLVAQPPGSSVTMPNGPAGNPNRTGFLADQAGTYTGQLVVTNQFGVQSDPCLVDLEVVPGEDLWVEMFWSQNGEDMDLHLVRDNGNLRSNQDCYYSNCTRGGLSWGPAGADGDPHLDLDDIGGRGPENINIAAPENTIYHVYVHDYPASNRASATDVTVNVYLGGTLAWTDTRSITGEDSTTLFADINWTTRTVTP